MILKPVGLESDPPPEESVDSVLRTQIDSTGDQLFIKPRGTIISNPALPGPSLNIGKDTRYETAPGPSQSLIKESVSEALTKAGILDGLIESERKKSTVRTSLKQNYADIPDAVRIIADNMRNADSYSVRQRAAERVLELHGIDSKSNSDFNINVVVDGQLNIANILNPIRERD